MHRYVGRLRQPGRQRVELDESRSDIKLHELTDIGTRFRFAEASQASGPFPLLREFVLRPRNSALNVLAADVMFLSRQTSPIPFHELVQTATSFRRRRM